MGHLNANRKQGTTKRGKQIVTLLTMSSDDLPDSMLPGARLGGGLDDDDLPDNACPSPELDTVVLTHTSLASSLGALTTTTTKRKKRMSLGMEATMKTTTKMRMKTRKLGPAESDKRRARSHRLCYNPS